jgi:transcriptional regulator NrdR family protein
MTCCPKCNGETRCTSSFVGTEGERLRRRKCLECDYRFYTLASGEKPLETWQLSWQRKAVGKPTFTVRTAA